MLKISYIYFIGLCNLTYSLKISVIFVHNRSKSCGKNAILLSVRIPHPKPVRENRILGQKKRSVRMRSVQKHYKTLDKKSLVRSF